MELLVTIGATQDKSLLQSFDVAFEKLVRKVEYLDLLAVEDRSEALAKTRTEMNQAMNRIAHLRMILSSSTKILKSSTTLAMESQQALERSLLCLDELAAERTNDGLRDSKTLEAKRRVIFAFVLGGFVANILICASLIIVFAKNFASRFSVLVDNTRRISESQTLHPLVTGNDELAELDKVMHDMDKSLRDAKERKEQLISMVTHDLRNPLSAMTVTLEFMSSGQLGEINDALSLQLGKMRNMVKRLLSLVNDILDLDKLRAGRVHPKMSVVEADDLVSECASELEALAQRLKVTIKGELRGIVVVADRERLVQILINLIGNALKYSPKGGEVRVFAEEEGEFVKFQVKDNGQGVPDAYKDIIFLPFEQIPDDKRPNRGSTGLGLPICKMLVDLHGGKIGVDSSSAGSTFWFTIPKAEIETI